MNASNTESEQANNHKPMQKESIHQRFNWAIFLGCCVIALSIHSSGHRIAGRIPHSLHGHFSGALTDGNFTAREFMSDWEAANFLLMDHSEFIRIVESGELSGTYTVFQVERREWWSEEIYEHMRNRYGDVYEAVIPDRYPIAHSLPSSYEVVFTADHRVFSRELLAEWIMRRIDN